MPYTWMDRLRNDFLDFKQRMLPMEQKSEEFNGIFNFQLEVSDFLNKRWEDSGVDRNLL